MEIYLKYILMGMLRLETQRFFSNILKWLILKQGISSRDW
jgi:hypothetical protein